MAFTVSERRPAMASPRARRPAGIVHRICLGRRPTAPAQLSRTGAAVWMVLRVIRQLTLGDHHLAWRLAMVATVIVAVVVVAGSLVYVGVGTVLVWAWQHP